MNQFEKDRLVINYNNCGFFSPKIENFRHLNLNKIYKNLANYSTYSRFAQSFIASPINLHSRSKKNISCYNFYSPDCSNISTMISPIHRNASKISKKAKMNQIRKSSSQKNISSRPLTCRAKSSFPSVSNSILVSPTNNRQYSSRHKSIKKIVYDNLMNLNDSFSKKQNFYNIEVEKLFQETRQIKNLTKILGKELLELKQENVKKDKLINFKEKQINNIIMHNNRKKYENNKNNNKINQKELSVAFNESINKNHDNSSIFNESIYANTILNNRNTSIGHLFFKIKNEIKKTNDEISLQDEKIQQLKHSTHNTTVNELKIESELLEDQINKIKLLLTNALQVKAKNDRKKNEIKNFKENIAKQDKIIQNLICLTEKLENEEQELSIKYDKNENDLNIKIQKVNKNNFNLNKLKKKNENLTKQKVVNNNIKHKFQINGNPIIISSVYKKKISELKKSIKFYKKQIRSTDSEISKLKERRKKLLDTEKLNSIKNNSNTIDNNDNHTNIKISIQKKDNYLNMNSPKKIPEAELIADLKKKLRDSKEIEKKLEEKRVLYQQKLKEIDIKEETEKEEVNDSQIEFGIDENNPYYSEDEKNIPEVSSKFTSSQFNQFTYVLFKNFESKGIIPDESKNKVIIPFVEFVNQNNIGMVDYPSNTFDVLVEEFTNIILRSLNLNNPSNHILTKIFVSALLYNAGCDLNKFVECFSILFSYTKNYASEEEKLKNNLKEKYKEQTMKIITCISTYINNELKDAVYFPLLKMKEILDKNDIFLKDKYIEFLFYYMKKFDDPESKLSDLKFSLLYDIISLNSNELENFVKKDNTNSNSNFNENNISNNEVLEEENKNNSSKKEDSKSHQIEPDPEEQEPEQEQELESEKDKKESIKNDKRSSSKKKKSPTEGSISNRGKYKHHTDKNDKDNSDDYEEDEDDSMTEITNEEYVKQLKESIALIHKGIKDSKTTFAELMGSVIQKRKITGVFYDCITIEDFNEQLKSINVLLTDLKLSCLCSKYSIPNELRLIDKNKIERAIIDQSNGKLKLEEEEDDEE